MTARPRLTIAQRIAKLDARALYLKKRADHLAAQTEAHAAKAAGLAARLRAEAEAGR